MKYEKIESINWEKEFPDVPDCVYDAIDSANRQIMENKNRRAKEKHVPKKRMLLLVAVITLLSGMTVVAATSFWQQRMEAMNRQEVEQYYLAIEESNAPAFRYNRMMTEEELALFKEMKVCYENEGIFPEGVLTMLDCSEDYNGKGVGYDSQSGTFFLPDKELNKEQILQIIDFYHKVAYAVSDTNKEIGSEGTDEPLKGQVGNESIEEYEKTGDNDKTDEGAMVKAQLNYQSLNNVVSYCEMPLQVEELLVDIAVGKEYLYLGSQTEIRRMVLGNDSIEEFYKLKENESLFAMNSDGFDNVYVSIREYDAESNSYINRIIKINADGEVVVEYDLKNTENAEGKTLQYLMANTMIVDEKGQLYVKCAWDTMVSIYVFDSEGSNIGKIASEEYTTHRANEMCFGKDGFLYLIAEEDIVKINPDTKEILEAYDYMADEMIAAVDTLHPMGDHSFYVLSYDGLFRYIIGETGSERMLAPYETDVLAEAYRYAPISENELVFINMVDYDTLKYKITYLMFSE